MEDPVVQKTYVDFIFSAAFGVIVATMVTVLFHFLNERAKRRLEEKKIFFEKAWEAYNSFQKYCSGKILFYSSNRANASTLKEMLQKGYRFNQLNTLIDSFGEKADKYNIDGTDSMNLDLFVDLEACVPKDLETAVASFDLIIHEVVWKGRIQNADKSEITVAEYNSLLDQITLKSTEALTLFDKYLLSVNKAFSKKYNF